MFDIDGNWKIYMDWNMSWAEIKAICVWDEVFLKLFITHVNKWI